VLTELEVDMVARFYIVEALQESLA